MMRQIERATRLMAAVPDHVRLFVLAAVGFVSVALPMLLRDGLDDWHVVSAVVSYPSHGFVRRGLAGTVLRPFLSDADDARVALVALGVVAGVLLAWLLSLLVSMLDDPLQRNALVVAAVPVFTQLGRVVGHEDGLILATLAAVALLLLRGRVLPAVGVLVVGALVHEIALLYGGVLFLAAARTGRLRRVELVAVAVTTVGLASTLLTLGRFEAGHEEFMSRLLPGTPTDFGGIFTRSEPWTGSLADGLADVAFYLGTPPGIVSSILLALVLFVTARALVSRGFPVIAVAALAATLALSVVAIDYNRWLVFHGFVTLLLLALVGRLPRIGDRGVFALGLVLLVLGPAGGAVPLPRWN